MEQNPLNSRDAMHGIPPLWDDLLNEITKEDENYGFSQGSDNYVQNQEEADNFPDSSLMTMDMTGQHQLDQSEMSGVKDLSQIKHEVSIGLNENTQGLIDQ